MIIYPGNDFLVIDVSLLLNSINTCEIALSNWKCTIVIFVYMHYDKSMLLLDFLFFILTEEIIKNNIM